MRNSIQDFSLANRIYAGATVTFYTVSGGAKTTTKATLYNSTTGSTTLTNPQYLDNEGKFVQPVYIEVPVVATVSGLTIADHDTGIIHNILSLDTLVVGGPLEILRMNAAGDDVESKTVAELGLEELSHKDATGGYVGLTLFKINFKNALNTITSFFTNSNTVARTYTFQNRDGTIADDTDLALKASTADVALKASLSALAASTGATLIGFIQAGTGAVLRTLQSKLRDAISVLDFGAVRDGAADDTVALQAAVDAVAAAGGGAVYLNPGRYKITADWEIPAGVSIYGAGGQASVVECYSCTGLKFVSDSYDNGNVFFENFGLLGKSGADYPAVESILPAGGSSGTDSRDGLHFNKLTVRDFDTAFNISDTWEWSATKCKISKVNRAFTLGTYCMVGRILDNFITHETGDSFSGTSSIDGINFTGPICEGITVSGNQIYGFEKDIVLYAGTYITISDNDMLGTEYGVYMSAINGVLNIDRNYIAISGASGTAGVYELAQGSEVPNEINIEGNTFVATTTTTCYGVKLGTAGATYAFHNRIVGNHFSGFSAEDIYTNNPGKLVIRENRCMSSGTALSISIDTISAAPVIVEKNECTGTIFYDASDRLSGKLVLRDNVTSGTTQDTSFMVAGDIFTVAWTDYLATSTKVGWVTPSGTIYYKKIGNLVFVAFNLSGTSNATGTTFTLPYTATVVASGVCGYAEDNGSALATPARFHLPASSAAVTLYKDTASTAWTNSGTKTVLGEFWYKVA